MVFRTGTKKTTIGNGQMKLNPTHTKYIGIGIVFICLLVLLFALFRSYRKTELNTHEELIESHKQTIEAEKKVQQAWELVAAEKDKTIAQILQKDSILQIQYLNHQRVYSNLNAKINNIPAFIDRIANNDDSIRRAYSTTR